MYAASGSGASVSPVGRWHRTRPAVERAAHAVGLGLVPLSAPDHGTRATYQYDGCRCTACRAAEATYRQQLRATHRVGKRPLGTVLSPLEARRRIDALKREHVTAHQVAQALGLVHHAPRLHPDGITLRKLLKIRRLHRLVLRGGLPT